MTEYAKDVFQRGYTDAFYGKDNSSSYDGVLQDVYQKGQEEFYKEFNDSENQALLQFTQLAKEDIANGDVSSVQSLRDKLAARKERLK